MALRQIQTRPSSNIARVEYDDGSGDLIITFWKGSGKYLQVPVQTAEGFETAPSPGQYLNTYVKNLFVWERIS